MNRKQKIIVSITGIVIVVLTLLGLTYAYFVTTIQGNENDKSIEVSTANLLLTYADDNGLITAKNIIPGYTTNEKTFTVKNNGNQTVGNYKVYLENVINTFTNTNDIVINMTCTSSIEDKTCLGLTDTMFPTTNDLLVSNSIDVGETQIYLLTVTYKETGVDQSIDMNKTLSGKIQIYDARNIVDISGTVPNAVDGDYVELHSEPKTSNINNNKEYKITGVSAGEHIFYIKDLEGNIKGSKTITINRTNFISHEDTTINITNSTNSVKIDVTNITSDLGIEINNIIENPYNKNSNTLAYNIINNAQLNKNRTTYEPTPLTVPAKDLTKVYSYSKYEEKESSSFGVTSDHFEQYFTYGKKFIFDENKAFTLTETGCCKYSDPICKQTLIGAYVIDNSQYNNSSETNTLKNTNLLPSIYKIESIDSNKNYVYYTRFAGIPDSAERTISKTQDDYGDTYYFRGDIKDNYINFNGMCWRIVRIEGDGAIKLISEDINEKCSTSMDSTTLSKLPYGFKTATSSSGKIINKNDFYNYKGGVIDDLESFQKNKLNMVLDKLKKEEWCIDDTGYYTDYYGKNKINDVTSYYESGKIFFYEGYNKIQNTHVFDNKCNGTKITKYRDETTMYVGLLTAYEDSFAGGHVNPKNRNYYIYGNSSYTLTSYHFNISDTVFSTGLSGFDVSIFSYYSSRPSIALKSDIEIISGDGTINNPYEIN